MPVKKKKVRKKVTKKKRVKKIIKKSVLLENFKKAEKAKSRVAEENERKLNKIMEKMKTNVFGHRQYIHLLRFEKAKERRNYHNHALRFYARNR